MKFKRLLYLGYYLQELDKNKFRLFQDHVVKETGKSALSLKWDILTSVLRYNISILEYFQFRFYKLNGAERKKFAGTGFMYEYQLQMNPKSNRKVLEDKVEFLTHYAPYVRHQHASVNELEKDRQLADNILGNSSGKVVLKSSDGQCGIGIEVRPSSDFTADSLISRLRQTDNDLVEEFVVQHQDLMRLSPSGLNTLRVITQLDRSGKVDILGVRLRITVNSSVDNMAAGNIAAPVDPETGITTGPGVYSDITKQDEYKHPVTGVEIVGFKVPYWKESIQMAKDAALTDTSNRSIGWDIAITDAGPELIEGNHDWCKLLWQLPAKKGLRPLLENYLH